MNEETGDPWAPPGFANFYRMTLKSGLPGHAIEASVTVPDQDESDFNGALVSRIGGLVVEDEEFRRELYYHVGEVSVVSAQVELNVKRAITLLSRPGSGKLAEAEGMFAKLESMALAAASSTLRRKGATASDRARAEALRDAIAWSKRQRLGPRRNDVVHGAWWDYAGVGVAMARFRRDGSSSILIDVSMKPLVDLAADLRKMSARLEALIGTEWLTAYLPRGGPQPPSPDVLAARALADLDGSDIL